MMQLEDLGFCKKGEGARVRAFAELHDRRHVSAQHLRRPALGRPGRRGRRLSRAGRGDAPAHRPADRHAGGRRRARPGIRLRHDQLRSRPVVLPPPFSRGPRDRTARPPQAQEPAPAHAAAAVAAGHPQPHRAWPDGGRRRGPLRAAGLPRLQRRDLSAARRLSVVPVGAAAVSRCRQRRHAGRRDHGADLDRSVLPRAHAVAGRHGEARRRAGGGRPSARRRRRRRPRAAAIEARQERLGGGAGAAGEGHPEHGRRSASARDDLRSEIPPRADHRRPHRRRPGDGEGVLRGRRLDRVRRPRRSLEAVPRPRCAEEDRARRDRAARRDRHRVRDRAGRAERRPHRHRRQHRRACPLRRRGRPPRSHRRPRGDRHPLSRPAAPGPGVRPGAALSRRRRRQLGRRPSSICSRSTR